MKRIFQIKLVTFVLFFTSYTEAVGNRAPSSPPPNNGGGGENSAILKKYSYVDQSKLINREALSEALLYYDANKNSLSNANYLTIIDFTKHSNTRRFYLIDMRDGDVEALKTAHGSGSDTNNDGYAEKFSNTSGSKMSSLGFYKTAETYTGDNGYSLRLDGLSSTNSRARSRAIVIHGAGYINESGGSWTGRSWGCPALDDSLSTRIINLIRGGSIIYAWAG